MSKTNKNCERSLENLEKHCSRPLYDKNHKKAWKNIKKDFCTILYIPEFNKWIYMIYDFYHSHGEHME